MMMVWIFLPRARGRKKSVKQASGDDSCQVRAADTAVIRGEYSQEYR
jgi:hypothetical protein